jgi:hypothetical protein
MARMALGKLGNYGVGSMEWKSQLLPLVPEDILPLIECKDGQSEGHRTLSWIWKVVRVKSSNDNAGVQEGSSIIYL